MPVTRSHAIISGKPVAFETGKFAAQAGGAVTCRYGDTIVFAAAIEQGFAPGALLDRLDTVIDAGPIGYSAPSRLRSFRRQIRLRRASHA